MESKTDKCLNIDQNDCIYIINLEDINSNDGRPCLENDCNFYVIEEKDDSESHPLEVLKDLETDTNPAHSSIVYEISGDELLENSLIDKQSILVAKESSDSKSVKQFICSQCQSSFSRRYSLKVHIRTHTGEKPYRCTFDCPKSFATSGDLQRHVRVHTGDRPYKCNYEGCNFTFTTKGNLGTHFRKHIGERPYKCNFKDCEKTFVQLTNLKNHERVHTGEKPYECDICKKCFTEYATLYKHRLTHIPSKHYVCPVCNASFRRAGTLVKHVSQNHPQYEDFDVRLTEIVIKENK